MKTYSSTVGLVLTAEAAEKLKAKVAALPKDKRGFLKNADDHRTRKGVRLFFWNIVTKEEHRFLARFLKGIPVTEYHLCRVGDDLTDAEESGMLEDPFALHLIREVALG